MYGVIAPLLESLNKLWCAGAPLRYPIGDVKYVRARLISATADLRGMSHFTNMMQAPTLVGACVCCEQVTLPSIMPLDVILGKVVSGVMDVGQWGGWGGGAG